MATIKQRSFGGAVDVSEMEALTKGQLIVGDGSGAPSKLNIGANDTVLTADSAEGTGAKWSAVSADKGEGHIRVGIWSPDSVGQGTWAMAASGALYNFRFENTTTADADNVSYKVTLTTGTYTLVIIHDTINSGGKVDVSLAGTTVLTGLDTYSASQTSNVISTTTSISVTSEGVQTLKFTLNGKNASSSDYSLLLNEVFLYRTA